MKRSGSPLPWHKVVVGLPGPGLGQRQGGQQEHLQVDGQDEDCNEFRDDFGWRASREHLESFLIHDPYFDVGHCWRESIAVVTLDKNLWASHGTAGPQRYFVKVFQYIH